MNLDDLTIGEAKQLAAMFAANTPAAPTKGQHPFVGRYVLCRCYSAGVHTGDLVSVDGDTVILKNSRRLWKWVAKDGIALSGVAQFGLDIESKVDTVNPEIYLTGVIEVIPCTDAARSSIHEYNCK